MTATHPQAFLSAATMARTQTQGRRLAGEENSFSQYLREISRHSALAPDREAALAARIRGGDRAALETLVEANLRFVVSVSRNYQGQGLPLCDLVNEGNIGLIRAARRFDEKKNFKFISYAVWWVRQAILQALAQQSRIITLPLNRVGAIHRVGKTKARLEQKLRRQPNIEEIAGELNIGRRDVCECLRIGNSHVSLDAPLHAGEDVRLVDLLQYGEQESPDAGLMQVSLRDEVNRTLGTLNARERTVVQLYFGIGEEAAHTLDDIGRRLRLTRERVRQIKEKAIRRLKHMARCRRLMAFAS
jgi:RNA polymerase primary sigma factor